MSSELKITLRERTPIDDLTEILLEQPLSNGQIDDNFLFLNKNKLSVDGSNMAEKISFDGIDIQKQTGNLVITGNVKVEGNLLVANEIVSPEASDNTIFNIGINHGTLSDLINNNAGISFGSPARLYINLDEDINENYWWQFITADGSPIGVEIRAKDFTIFDDSTISLLTLNTQLDDFINNSFSGEYNSFSEEASIVNAIEALDNENIPNIKNYIGLGELNTAYENHNIISNEHNLTEAIKALDANAAFIIHNVQDINDVQSVIKVGTYSIIDVQGDQDIILDNNDGKIVLKYVGDDSITLKPSAGQTIEQSDDGILVDVKNLVVTLIKANSSDWRII